MSAAGDKQCPNCAATYDADDIFCESCGYDFITGSLPSAEEIQRLPLHPAAPGVVATEAPVGPSASGPSAGGEIPGALLLRVEVAVDRDYFEAVVSEGELDFPDPVPETRQLELAGPEVHIGRASHSRAIHPDIDLAVLTGDPAVSSRHAVLRVGNDGALTITDVGSTNGTIIGTVDGAPVVVGATTAIHPGTPVYLGAWTRLVVTP